MNVRAVVWRSRGDRLGRHDGCSTRREALLDVVGRHAALEVLDLETRGGLVDAARHLVALVRFLRRRGSLATLLFFYPDFPLFHPPRRVKVPLLRLVLAEAGRTCRRTGARLHLDVVDLPRWQARDLGYRLRMPEAALAAAERCLVAAADRVTIPSAALAELWRRDLGLADGLLQVVPNGLPDRCYAPTPAAPADFVPPVFLYAGDLSQDRNRGIPELVRGFVAAAPSRATLALCGEGGAWLDGEVRDPRVRHLGHLDEAACLALCAAADFCLVPYPETDYCRWCYPSKLGLYLAAGTPVLSTELDETVRILTELGVGEARPFARFASFFTDATLAARWPREQVRERSRLQRFEPAVVSAFGLAG